jgi:Ca2+-binding EF-hand superfamily protein
MKAVTLAALATLGLAIGATAQQTSRQPIRTLDGQDRTAQISFDQADKNRDGRVNRVEFTAIADFDFSSADANDDLLLSRPEFAAAMARAASRGDGQPSARSGDRTAQVDFEAVDTNNDDRIDAAEAEEVPRFNFRSADVDDDGSLSRREFQTAMANSRPRG